MMKLRIPILTRLWEVYQERQQYRKQVQHRLLRRRKITRDKDPETGHWTDRFLKSIPLNNIRCLTLLLLLVVLGQQSSGQVVPLKVGDRIESLNIKAIINYPDSSLNTKNFKGKVIILDFWSTYCGSCIQNMPHLVALQKQFKDSLLILPVTAEPKERIEKALLSNPILKSISFPTAVGDTKLKQLFPHQFVPHIVWISPDGTFLGSTLVEYVTPENIRKVYEGKSPTWQIKSDEDVMDPSKVSLHAYLKKDVDTPVLSYIEGLKPRSGMVKLADSSVRFFMVNTPLVNMYAIATQREGIPYEPKRRIIKISNPLQFEYQASAGFQADWSKQYAISYERILAPHTSLAERNSLLLKDLNAHFNFNGRIEDSPTKVWLLRWKDAVQKKLLDKPANGIYLQSLLAEMNRIPDIPWIINESGLAGKTLLPIALKSKDINIIKAELGKQGLELVADVRDLPTFMLEENKTPLTSNSKLAP